MEIAIKISRIINLKTKKDSFSIVVKLTKAKYHLRRTTAFPTLHVGPAKTQIILRIRTVRSESSQGNLWVAKDPKRFQADIEDSNQTAQMRRLI